jgi:hypothetical protein
MSVDGYCAIMPSLRLRQAPFEELDAEEEAALEADVRQIVRAAREMGHSRVRDETLKIAWFLLTERGKSRGRKWKTRYRTRRAVEDPEARVIHEHVVTRRFLSWAALQPIELCEVLMLADACLTTVEEHRALERVDPQAFGWERYQIAEIEVLDSQTFTAVDLAPLVERQLGLRRKIEANNNATWDPQDRAARRRDWKCKD